MLAALANVRPTHLLDPDLWRRLGIHVAEDDENDDPEPMKPQRLVRS
jgi:hypothetical protein